jgi:hypothetical protein
MGLRLFCALAVCLAFVPEAVAGEQPGTFRRASCSVVRFYVAKYSEAAAESWARSKGASEAEIDSARRCLRGTSVRTAQN